MVDMQTQTVKTALHVSVFSWCHHQAQA